MAQYVRTDERAKVLDRYPDYAVDVRPALGRFTAVIDGHIIADSVDALDVRESFHEAVIYFPPDDVDFEVLERTAHRTRCPFKGDASYYAIRTAASRHENAVWCYEAPMKEVAALEGCLAFYPDSVRVRRAE